MHFRSAWVEIAGKVFVEESEFKDALHEKYPEKCSYSEEEDEWTENTTLEEEKALFESMAMEKLFDLFPTDDPFKEKGINIDMTTYQP
jgi:hypothetical protein